jgi:hypothetical protein
MHFKPTNLIISHWIGWLMYFINSHFMKTKPPLGRKWIRSQISWSQSSTITYVLHRRRQKCSNQDAIGIQQYFVITKSKVCFLSLTSIFVHLFSLRVGQVDSQKLCHGKQEVGPGSQMPGYIQYTVYSLQTKAACAHVYQLAIAQILLTEGASNSNETVRRLVFPLCTSSPNICGKVPSFITHQSL